MEALQVRTPIDVAHSVMSAVLDESVPLRDAVKRHGLSMGQFGRLLAKDKAAAAAVAAARELRADVLVDEAIHIADNEPDAAKARNQIAVRHWTAERFHRKQYGASLDVNVTQTLDIGGTLAEAKARLVQPVCDQLDTSITDATLKLPLRVGNRPLPAEPEPPQDGRPLVPDIFS